MAERSLNLGPLPAIDLVGHQICLLVEGAMAFQQAQEGMVAGPTPGALAVNPATEGAMSIRSQGGGIDGAALVKRGDERFAHVVMVVRVFLKIHDQTSRLNPMPGFSRRMVSDRFFAATLSTVLVVCGGRHVMALACPRLGGWIGLPGALA
ncbi:hypothetical protein [Caulobacter hibisci]|uniref:Uncharacterized protein n=1 Tax=Caulobacter hibisci TaxID=2035993 RepID=A0ABS0SX76_9CAUL|nr:hypothetical protein [Caulobacter hibisci]MBI1684230.1 hypothetical protein [Caulobacter hibisci]